MKVLFALATVALLVGCGDSDPAERATAPVPEKGPAAAASSPPTDAWVGHWRGVEGLSLDILKDDAAGPGHYRLTMQYGLDATDSGTFAGKAVKGEIHFSRPADGPQSLRATTGEETGLKWLAEKKDCLTVKPGEGYCRD